MCLHVGYIQCTGIGIDRAKQQSTCAFLQMCSGLDGGVAKPFVGQLHSAGR